LQVVWQQTFWVCGAMVRWRWWWFVGYVVGVVEGGEEFGYVAGVVEVDWHQIDRAFV
jgi:hypothetical protein